MINLSVLENAVRRYHRGRSITFYDFNLKSVKRIEIKEVLIETSNIYLMDKVNAGFHNLISYLFYLRKFNESRYS